MFPLPFAKLLGSSPYDVIRTLWESHKLLVVATFVVFGLIIIGSIYAITRYWFRRARARIGGRLPSKLNIWLPPLLVVILIIALAYFWYVTFPASAWVERPNYLQMYVDFIVSRPVDAFLTVNVGPGGVIGGTFIAVYSGIALHTILYLVGRRVKRQFNLINPIYIVYVVMLALFAITFQNAAQHYNWYWNPELDAPGYVDTWTHITSPWLLGALFLPFAFERYLGWKRKYYWFPILAIMVTIALGWEIVETLDVTIRPESTLYFNYPMDSLKDIVLGSVIGTVLSCWIYERLVIDKEVSPETAE